LSYVWCIIWCRVKDASIYFISSYGKSFER